MNKSILFEVIKSNPIPALLIGQDSSGLNILRCSTSFVEQFHLLEVEISDKSPSIVYAKMGLKEKEARQIDNLFKSNSKVLQNKQFKNLHKEQIDDLSVLGEHFRLEHIPLSSKGSTDLYILQYWHKQTGSDTGILPESELNDNGKGLKLKYELFETILSEVANQAYEIERTKINQEALINSSSDLIWSVDMDCRLIAANQAFIRSFVLKTGKEVKEGDSLLNRAFGDQLVSEWNKLYLKAFNGNEFKVNRESSDPVSGERIYTIVSFSPIKDDNNKQFGVACYSRDITSETENLRAYKEAVAAFQAIMDSSPDIICTMNESGEFLDISAASTQILGYKPSELKGIRALDFVHPEDIALTVRAAEEIIRGIEISNFENRYIRKDGTIINLLWSVRWDTPSARLYCVAKDVTDIKRTEAELKVKERRYRSLVENGADAIVILDVMGTPTYVSPTVKNILGYSEEEALKLNLFELLHSDDRQGVVKKMQECMNKPGIPIAGHTSRAKHKDGSWRWLEATITNLLHDPEINGIVDNFRDVTEKRQSEIEMNLLMNNSEESFVLLNTELKIVSFNQQFNRLYKKYFGREVEKDKSIMDYVAPGRVTEVFERYQRVLMGKEEESELVIPLQGTDKVVFSLHYKSALDEFNKVIGVFVTITDVTDKKIILKRLQESEEKYKLLFQSSPLPQFIYDLNSFRILDCNDTALMHYGYSLKRILSMSIMDLYTKQESEKVISAHAGVEANRGTISFGTFWQIKVNGDLIKSEVSGHRFDYMGRACMMVVHNDITEKDRMFQQLKENETKLLTAQKIARVGYWQSVPDTKFLYWSDELYEIWGLDKSKVKLDYDYLISSIHHEDRKAFLASRKKALNGEGDHDIRHRILLPDGSIKWIHAKGNLIRDENGKILVFEGTTQDITESHLAMERLMVSESRYRGIIESQTNFMFRTDLEGNLSYCNNKYHQEFGWLYPDSDMLGQPSMNAVMDYHHPRVYEVVEKCFKHPNKVFQVELDKPSQVKGKIITTLWDFICLTGAENQPLEIQCVGIDISERVKAKNELQLAFDERNQILESIGDGFFAVDRDWIVTYWNKEAEKLLGPKKQQMINQYLWDIFSKSQNSLSYQYYQKAIETGQVVNFEDYYEPMKKWYEISAYPSGEGLSVYFKDITERKIHEDQMKEINDILRIHVKELAISNRELEQFAYVASHDLQEPLRMISGFLSQLEKKYSDKLDHKAHQYIHFAVDGAKRMRQIILDLLDFSRAGRFDQALELVNVNEVIDEILLLLGKEIQDKKAELRVHSLPIINAPKAAIRQLLQNLISNSLKYSSKESNPIIELNAEESEDEIRFSVKDNGIGISEDYFDKIFIIFQRLHNKDEYSGTGMGLAICRKLLDNMGGKIWVESTEGKGSTFYFTIPKSLKIA
ncbi:MAG: PAS domain S-box protein [Daejeonella sp.]|uniref:PAS domain S-box protein n=1 Tax=Daejeonella sp. TaxID=2805397 RepID=UPI002734CD26|nr:PAS domain S-box protein [Daejeonella sp.]MDP3469430.1 PAS domain S-box protein [Daejeonella sp.]